MAKGVKASPPQPPTLSRTPAFILKYLGLTLQLILEVVNPNSKILLKDKTVELISHRAVRLKGALLEALPENRYQFKNLEGELQIVHGDEFYEIILI